MKHLKITVIKSQNLSSWIWPPPPSKLNNLTDFEIHTRYQWCLLKPLKGQLTWWWWQILHVDHKLASLCTKTHQNFWKFEDAYVSMKKTSKNIVPKVHWFCKECLHKYLVFLNWQLTSALATLEKFGEEYILCFV